MNMVQRLYLCVAFLLFASLIFGQKTVSLFKLDKTSERNSFLRNDQNSTYLKINRRAYNKISKSTERNLSFLIPSHENDEGMIVDLEETNIVTDNFILTMETELGSESVKPNLGKYYIGKVQGNPSSFAAISIFNDEIVGVISVNNQSFNLEKIGRNKLQASEDYIFYPEKENSKGFECHTADENLPQILNESFDQGLDANIRNSAASTVEIYLECDYRMYLDNGSSTSNVTNFTTGLFNVVAGIFNNAGGNNQGPDLLLSELKIWTIQDPYGATTIGSSSVVLGNFSCNLASYNGRIAHLLSTSPLGLGGIAQVPSCPSSGEITNSIYGFSNINNSYSANLNNYTWTVNVLTHELGHNLGSPHTHACFWNGNNSSIDDCGNKYYADNGFTPEGAGCYNANNPKIPNEGTIMSYCHLLSGVGIDLAAGFHPQVATQIINTANCLSTDMGCAAPGTQDLFTSDLDLTAKTIRLNCSATGPDISFYYWAWKKVTESEWNYSDVTAEPYYDIDVMLDNSYKFVVSVYCVNTGFTSFSCNYPFYTGEISCEEVMDVSYNPIPEDIYEANQLITSSGVVNNGDVMFDSGNEVVLDAGFEVTLNATFTATVDGGCITNIVSSKAAQKK